MYDYGRKDREGHERQLHIRDALEVTKRDRMGCGYSFGPHVAKCDYFTVDKIYLDGRTMSSMKGYVGDESFVSLLVIDGGGTIRQGEQSIDIKKGDSIFISAGSGSYEMEGELEGLMTRV